MRSEELPAGVRPAVIEDIEALAEILSDAFSEDPVWKPVFRDTSNQLRAAFRYWAFIVREALRFDDSLVLQQDDGELLALAIWCPPGENDISDAAEPELDALVEDLFGAEAQVALRQMGERFANARPKEPHAYLSLLAVSSKARGHGYGMSLLQTALNQYDSQGMPTYLESSNHVNDQRYERLGYQPRTLVELEDGTSARTYWRDAV